MLFKVAVFTLGLEVFHQRLGDLLLWVSSLCKSDRLGDFSIISQYTFVAAMGSFFGAFAITVI